MRPPLYTVYHIPHTAPTFTLAEIILSISLISIILLSISTVLVITTSSKIKNQTIEDVDNSGAQAAMTRMTQTIRNATNVTTPGVGATTTTLVLAMADTNKNPTSFYINNGALMITEGGGAAVPLTSSRVIVSAVSFTNLAQSGTKGIIRITFTVAGSSASTKAEYGYTKTFNGTAAIR